MWRVHDQVRIHSIKKFYVIYIQVHFQVVSQYIPQVHAWESRRTGTGLRGVAHAYTALIRNVCKCPIYECFIRKQSALYAKCPYYLVMYNIHEVSLLFSALYAKCPHYLVLYLKSVLIM